MDKLIFLVVYFLVIVAIDGKGVVGSPPVGIDICAASHGCPDDGENFLLRCIRNDLGIDLPIALQEAENNNFSPCTTTPFPSLPPRIKSTFINLHAIGNALYLTFMDGLGDHERTKDRVVPVYRVPVEVNEFCRLRCRDIQCKILN